MFRGLYYSDTFHTYPDPDYQDLEAKGLNHLAQVFRTKDVLGANYESMVKTRLENTITALAGTNIELYVDFNIFTNATGASVDPTDTDHLTLIYSTINSLLEEFPDIRGVLCDDYTYPSTYFWQLPDVTPYTSTGSTQGNATMLEVATTLKEVVTDVDSDIILSGNIGPTETRSTSPELLKDVWDFIILGCDYTGDYETCVETGKENSGDALVYSEVLTYYTPAGNKNYVPTNILQTMIKNSIQAGADGYILWDYPLMHPITKFPCLPRSSVNTRPEVDDRGVVSSRNDRMED